MNIGQSGSFLSEFSRAVAEFRWRTDLGPADAVEQWREFVDACTSGYASSIYEYENDRSIRDLIQYAL